MGTLKIKFPKRYFFSVLPCKANFSPARINHVKLFWAVLTTFLPCFFIQNAQSWASIQEHWHTSVINQTRNNTWPLNTYKFPLYTLYLGTNSGSLNCSWRLVDPRQSPLSVSRCTEAIWSIMAVILTMITSNSCWFLTAQLLLLLFQPFELQINGCHQALKLWNFETIFILLHNI